MPPFSKDSPQSHDVAGRKRSFLRPYNGRVVPAFVLREPDGVPQSPVGADAPAPGGFVADGEARYKMLLRDVHAPYVRGETWYSVTGASS